MKIAIDCRRIRDFGVGTYIRNLTHALARSGADHRYSLIVRPEDAKDLPPESEIVHHVIYRSDDVARSDDFSLPRLIRRLGVDLTHIPLHRVPLFMPRPYVVTVHDLSTVFYDDAPQPLHLARLFRLRRGTFRAARIIAVSGSTRDGIVRFFPEVSGRIRLIYNAPDQAFADATAADPEQQRRVLDRYQIHYPYLLYAGKINPRKNIPRLIEAFAVARAQLAADPLLAELRLIVIGDDIGGHPEVRHAVARAGVEPFVRFLGFVPAATLREFHRAARAFVFPSLYEGFGLPPLEAMTCGTPVVAAQTSALPEVTGDAARLVNPENVFDIARGIIDVLTSETLRRDLVQRGYRQAALFSWTRTAREVLEVYRDLSPARRSYPFAGTYSSRSSSAAK